MKKKTEHKILWTDSDGLTDRGEMDIDDYATEGWRIHSFQAVTFNRGFSEGIELAFLLVRDRNPENPD
jgi:hypothetical protein